MTREVESDFLQFVGVDVDGEIGNYTLPMPSDYKFEWKKTYVTEPSRSNSGAITSFPDKFFVPYFTVTWNAMKQDDYSKIMEYIMVDELVVRFWNATSQEYEEAKFYVQQPTYNKLYTMKAAFQYVTNVQLIFAGTMNDVASVTINYYDNTSSSGGNIISANTQTGLVGDEFEVSSSATRSGYTLKSWNTAIDGSGLAYAPTATRIMLRDTTLYAQWEAST